MHWYFMFYQNNRNNVQYVILLCTVCSYAQVNVVCDMYSKAKYCYCNPKNKMTSPCQWMPSQVPLRIHVCSHWFTTAVWNYLEEKEMFVNKPPQVTVRAVLLFINRRFFWLMGNMSLWRFSPVMFSGYCSLCEIHIWVSRSSYWTSTTS